MKYFITAIDTDVGKTIISAIVVKALGAAYWKPIQCGDLVFSDTMKVENLVENVTTFSEAYALEFPLSPHESARLSDVKVNMEKFSLPKERPIVVEGAGGLMVPLNDQGDLVIDIAKKIDAQIIIVIKNYLGSINHSLLTIDYLKRNNYTIKGLVINGESTPSSERIIEKISGCKILFRTPFCENVNSAFIEEQAEIARVALS
ncbi:MAG: dethiobiotin synthase [Parvicellaceae bacterium]